MHTLYDMFLLMGGGQLMGIWGDNYRWSFRKLFDEKIKNIYDNFYPIWNILLAIRIDNDEIDHKLSFIVITVAIKDTLYFKFV